MQQIVEMHHSTLSDNMPQVKKIYKSILDETIQSEPEIWKDIPLDYLPKHQASTHGRIRRVNFETGDWEICKTHPCSGYRTTYLKNTADYSGKFRVHRLIALTFIELPEEGKFKKLSFIPADGVPYIINHINGIRDDNRPRNIEWCDSAHNSKHAYLTNLTRNKVPCTVHDKLTNTIVDFNSMKDLSEFLNVDKASVPRVIANHTTLPYKGRYIFSNIDFNRLIESRNDRETDIIYRDYITGELTIVRTIKEASVKTGVSTETLRHRLIKDTNSNNDLLLSGYIFKVLKDKDTKWPEYTKDDALRSCKLYMAKFSSGDAKADSKALEVKDYTTGEIAVFINIKQALETYSYKRTTISEYLKPKDGSNTLPMFDGKVFRVLDFNYNWPEYTLEEAIESVRLKTLTDKEGTSARFRKLVYGKNYQTGEVREFNAAGDAGDQLGISKQAIQNAIYRKGWKLIKGWCFMVQGREIEWPNPSQEQINTSLL